VTWFAESLYENVRQSFAVEDVLYEGRSDFQDVRVLKTKDFGRMLVLDGVVQTTERDEFVYHEMLTHLPLFGHGGVRRVLIIGGGDGGILEEALKHPVERVVMVEIDPKVIEVSRTWLSGICGDAFDDPRVAVTIGDGAAFVAATAERFDLVIVDSSDPIGPAKILFAIPFYENCRRCLNPGGLMVVQSGVPFLQSEEATNTYRRLAKVYPHAGFYVAPVPTYYGGFMAFGWGGLRDLKATAAEARPRLVDVGLKLRYYNAAIHAGAFALPEYLNALMV
jgi:spermidine synthase